MVMRKTPVKREHIVALTLCPTTLLVCGKMRQHVTPRGHKKCFWSLSETVLHPEHKMNVARVAKQVIISRGNMITSAMLPPQCFLVSPAPESHNTVSLTPEVFPICFAFVGPKVHNLPSSHPHRAMLKLGRSKPWPEALEKLAGTRKMDVGPLKEYFDPLYKWMKKQREQEGYAVGWSRDPSVVPSGVAAATPTSLAIFSIVLFTMHLWKSRTSLRSVELMPGSYFCCHLNTHFV